MVETAAFAVVIFALVWVILWSLLQEKAKPGEPASGFFATKHDEKLREEKNRKATGS